MRVLYAWVGAREADRFPCRPRYTQPMSLALDPATEQRIQREIARGAYREPAELINRALDLLESQENWLLCNKDAIHQRLAESMAQAERGELHTPDEVRALLAQDRQGRASRPQ
jgi:Arc/MetJ-type ribon-helix-helix transcriptional regulator